MENQHEQNPPQTTVEQSLGEIARATNPPPAKLPESGPSHIPATTGDSNSTASLVLGIISLCLPLAGTLTAVFGLIFGLLARGRGGSKARIGIILNSIALGLNVIGVLVLIIIGILNSR